MSVYAGRLLFHLIGNIRRLQSGSKTLHIRIGAEKNRAALPLLQAAGNTFYHMAVLFFLPGKGLHGNGPDRRSGRHPAIRPFPVSRFQLLHKTVLVFPDHCQGCLHNLPPASVIHIQQKLPGPKLCRKAFQAFRLGSPEAIYGLVVVPHGKNIIRTGCQQLYRLILHGIDILEFIDQNMPETILPVISRSLVFLQQNPALIKHIVKIKPPRLLHRAFIRPADSLEMRLPSGGRFFAGLIHLHGIFVETDGRQHPGGIVIQAVLLLFLLFLLLFICPEYGNYQIFLFRTAQQFV